MRYLVAILAASAFADEFVVPPHGLDVLAFGAAYHTNRDYDWREWNPGAAIAPWVACGSHVEAFIACGGYANSTHDRTEMFAPGVRVFGTSGTWRFGVTASAALVSGYSRDVLPMCGAFAGWRRVSLECAAFPAASDGDVPRTLVVAAWLRVRVLDL